MSTRLIEVGPCEKRGHGRAVAITAKGYVYEAVQVAADHPFIAERRTIPCVFDGGEVEAEIYNYDTAYWPCPSCNFENVANGNFEHEEES